MWVATVRGIVGPIARDAYRLLGCLVVGRNLPRKSADLSLLEAGWKLAGSLLEAGWKLVGSLLEACWKLVGRWLEVGWKLVGSWLAAGLGVGLGAGLGAGWHGIEHITYDFQAEYTTKTKRTKTDLRVHFPRESEHAKNGVFTFPGKVNTKIRFHAVWFFVVYLV